MWPGCQTGATLGHADPALAPGQPGRPHALPAPPRPADPSHPRVLLSPRLHRGGDALRRARARRGGAPARLPHPPALPGRRPPRPMAAHQPGVRNEAAAGGRRRPDLPTGARVARPRGQRPSPGRVHHAGVVPPRARFQRVDGRGRGLPARRAAARPVRRVRAADHGRSLCAPCRRGRSGNRRECAGPRAASRRRAARR